MNMKITIPMPLLVSIDDVGWWKGTDGSGANQPFRTGMPRDHGPEDYLALAELGKRLDMRLLAGFVLCEWDRDPILQNLPSSTWMGKNWTAPGVDLDRKIKAAEIIQKAEKYIEFGLHGLGHEFWDQGVMQRSEFHDAGCRMRDPDEIRKHLSYFLKIMDQYDFGSRPKTFIPPALKHSFGGPDQGIQKILAEFGIESVTLLFSKARLYSSPQAGKMAWENDVLLVDRGESEIPWNRVAAGPEFKFDRPVMALHWANLLHPDPGQNFLVIEKWADYIKTGIAKRGMLLVQDSGACFTQYGHYLMSKIKETHGGFSIDLGWMDQVPPRLTKNPVYLKVDMPPGTDLDIYGAEPQPCLRAAEHPFLKLAVPGQSRRIFIRPRSLP